MARVLVVDDSPTIRRVVGSVLLRAGHEVAAAEDGERGLVEIEAFKPDLLLLDLTIPGKDGLAVLEELVRRDGAARPVVLMATRSDGLSGVDERLRRLGVLDVITKPFSPEALLAVVQNSLEKHHERVTAERTGLDHRRRSRASDFSDDERTVPATRVAASTVLAPAMAAISFADVPVTAPTTPRIELPLGYALVGELAHIPLPEILQLLKFQSHSGRLVIDTGELRFDVGLEDGGIVMLLATNADGGPARQGGFRLGRYLVATGAIDDDALEARLAAAPADGLIGERLVQSGAVDSDALYRGLSEQAQDLMVELLRARQGTFGLQIGAEHVPAQAVRPGWSIDALLFEALRRVDEWGVVESEVPSFEARFAVRGALDDAGLSTEESTILRGLAAGPARVREVVARSSLRPFDVCRVLYRLAVLKRIQRIDDGDPNRLLNDERPPAEPVLSTLPRRADHDA